MLVTDVRRAKRRAWAIVCVLIGIVSAVGLGSFAAAQPRTPSAHALPLGSTVARPPPAPRADLADRATESMPATRRTLAGPEGRPIHAYPPLPEGSSSRAPARPVVLMLHGMCGEALALCDGWSDGGRERAWLVCPTGNGACGGAADWKGTGEEKAAWLDAGVAELDAAFGASLDHAQGDVISGFSRGAFVARDVVYARPGRYRGAILIGAALTPDPARFKAAGIRRVVLAAGDFDGARPTMQRAAAQLTAGGVPGRYISLGPIGHALPRDLEARFRDALAWVRAPDPS
jgi:predicted esterase